MTQPDSDHAAAPAGARGPARVAFETLGCKLNQYETESIATALRSRGFVIATDDADAAVVNSCTVTARADRKSRKAVNRMLRTVDGPRGVVVLTGCFVDNHEEAAAPSRFRPDPAARFHGTIDGHHLYLVDNARKALIPDLLEAHFNGEVFSLDESAGDRFAYGEPERIFRTRATVKIQDGCDNYCTFCIIPFVRGRAESRPVADVVASCRAAIAGGAREIVLTGVNMSRYQTEDADFAALVEAILGLHGAFRVRISSLEPDTLDARFVALFRHPRMCPHLHLCLQSGSDRVLLAMRRMYTRAQYREVVARLRAIDPLFNITTDVIVGFPGETTEDLASTLEAIEEHRVSHVHTFPFSARRGTRAERLGRRVDRQEIDRRGRLVRDAAEREKVRYREHLVGKTVAVLVERVDRDGTAHGLCEYYVPVSIADARVQPNTVVSARIAGLASGPDPGLIATARGVAAS